MAVNKQNKSAQRAAATSMTAMTPNSGTVNDEKLILKTSGTCDYSSHTTSSSRTSRSRLPQQSSLQFVSPVQVDETPPDSLSQENIAAGNTDVTTNRRWHESTPQNDTTNAVYQVHDAATQLTESKPRSKLQTEPAAGRDDGAANVAMKFRPNDVTLKNLDVVKRDSKAKKMTILFIGNIAVGKTSLIGRVRDKKFQPTHNPTIDMTPSMIGATVCGQNYVVRLLDTAGEERFQAIMQSFYRHGDGGMVVYDLTDFESFDRITAWKLKLHEHCTTEDNIKFPIILLGNKADKNENHINGSETAQDLKMDGFFKTSAITGEGIMEAMKMMISLIDSRYRSKLKLVSQDGSAITLPCTSSGGSYHDHQQKRVRTPTARC